MCYCSTILHTRADNSGTELFDFHEKYDCKPFRQVDIRYHYVNRKKQQQRQQQQIVGPNKKLLKDGRTVCHTIKRTLLSHLYNLTFSNLQRHYSTFNV